MTQGGDVPGTSGADARGLFITFEGGDGAGKTTQIDHVRQWLQGRGLDVTVTREPGGTELGLDLRRLIQHGPEDVDPRTEALLYAADRAYHVATLVRPSLLAGLVVLGDRYIDSSLAYQGAARALGVDEIRALSTWATQGVEPDLTFLLDLPPEVGAARGTGTPDRLERESLDFHERVRHEYLRLAEENPTRIVVIDAVGTPDQVFSEIRGVLEERLPALLTGIAGVSPAPVTTPSDEGGPALVEAEVVEGGDGRVASDDAAEAAGSAEAAGPADGGTLGTLLTEAQGALWGAEDSLL